MRLHSIEIRNFRGFTAQDFDFASRFNLFIGDNGAGKTAALDAISVGVGSFLLGIPGMGGRSIAADDVRQTLSVLEGTAVLEEAGSVLVGCQGELDGRDLVWERERSGRDGRTKWGNAKSIKDAASSLYRRAKEERATLPVISYYGTGRLWYEARLSKGEVRRPGPRADGYEEALGARICTRDLMKWLKTKTIASIQQQTEPESLRTVSEAIARMVGGVTETGYDVSLDELILHRSDGGQIPFRLLSDGYRTMVAMAGDIARRAAVLNPHLDGDSLLGVPGIVLIDEIDLHLHPKWQRQVVQNLMDTFPAIQFFATTHSPFIIQSLRPSAEVKLLNLDAPDRNDYHGKSLEDVAEDVQNVEIPQRSQRYLDMMKAAEEYYSLLDGAEESSDTELRRRKEKLDELAMRFSDDPGYQAFLKMERLASGIDGERPR